MCVRVLCISQAVSKKTYNFTYISEIKTVSKKRNVIG